MLLICTNVASVLIMLIMLLLLFPWTKFSNDMGNAINLPYLQIDYLLKVFLSYGSVPKKVRHARLFGTGRDIW